MISSLATAVVAAFVVDSAVLVVVVRVAQSTIIWKQDCSGLFVVVVVDSVVVE